MIHSNKDDFFKLLESTAAQSGFSLNLLEKDYYITLLLSGINSLSKGLVFKGGTCLSKVYYSYYRLSEDLDFSMILPEGPLTRAMRRGVIKPVKDSIRQYVEGFGMEIGDINKAGHNQSTQYIYMIYYDSAVLGKKQSIKLEISLRFNPLFPQARRKVNHKFIHPFTKEPLFDAGVVSCLDLKELVAEKMRAAATRLDIAPRDFYDLWYLAANGFDFTDPGLWKIFKEKLAEDGFDAGLLKYRVNMGRSEKEVREMESRIEEELLDVLSPEAKKNFNLKTALETINRALKEMI
ncbi:MAG: hypothetical protein A2297_08715 [Elusimicrobia bacterium RIFOXYB2_FULL_48_7]|nr:MAG: hypothetical protein A2297_08715 [Elusimicrobia bacterium RIFOXYB2_FULL_48_7]